MLKESVADVFLPPRHCVVSPPQLPRGGERRGERAAGFTLVELLVVIAIISVIAGFLIPTLMKARGKADEVRCASNLREIQKLGMMYADSGGNRFYPLAKGSNPAAHESLDIIVKNNEGLRPEMFVCPTWRGEIAEPVDGKFTLEENSCSYTWPRTKVSPSDPNRELSCDKYVYSEENPSGHVGGRNVVRLDGSIQFLRTDELPAEELPKGLVR